MTTNPRTGVEPAPADPYLSLRALSAYSMLSVSTLRRAISDPRRPLPCFRMERKILVRRSEFDRWLLQFKAAPPADIAREIARIMARP